MVKHVLCVCLRALVLSCACVVVDTSSSGDQSWLTRAFLSLPLHQVSIIRSTAALVIPINFNLGYCPNSVAVGQSL